MNVFNMERMVSSLFNIWYSIFQEVKVSAPDFLVEDNKLYTFNESFVAFHREDEVARLVSFGQLMIDVEALLDIKKDMFIGNSNKLKSMVTVLKHEYGKIKPSVSYLDKNFIDLCLLYSYVLELSLLTNNSNRTLSAFKEKCDYSIYEELDLSMIPNNLDNLFNFYKTNEISNKLSKDEYLATRGAFLLLNEHILNIELRLSFGL